MKDVPVKLIESSRHKESVDGQTDRQSDYYRAPHLRWRGSNQTSLSRLELYWYRLTVLITRLTEAYIRTRSLCRDWSSTGLDYLFVESYFNEQVHLLKAI